MSNVRQARQALGVRLRELRLDARLSGRDLASRLGWQPSKVSKIELGNQTPSEDDIRQWVRATEAENAEPDLIATLRNLETLYAEWRRVLRTGTLARQLSILELEERSQRIHSFETAYVPGLLQTAEYARVRLSGAIERHGVPDDADEGVQARMRRQEILYRPDKHFHFVVTEAALRYGVVPPDVAMGQLDRLLALATMPRIKLGIVPMSAAHPVPPMHGFHLLDDRMVLVETFAAELTLTQPNEIAIYDRVFAQLAGIARYGPAAREVIISVLDDLARSTPDE